ncbi:hypothetical protein HDU98_011513, partial [Podochytrium sp. JEL0797]
MESERKRERSRSPGPSRERSSRYSSSRDADRESRRSSDRPERSDRERSERSDRGDRGDRGERSDRDRSTRDRERSDRGDRDRDRSDRDRDRGSDRKRSSRHEDRPPVVPIHERVRRLTFWDMAPPGYEGMTAQQVKLTGHFPLPGANPGKPAMPFGMQALMMPSNPAIHMGDGSLPYGMAAPAAAASARQSKKLYIGGIPPTINEVISFM